MKRNSVLAAALVMAIGFAGLAPQPASASPASHASATLMPGGDFLACLLGSTPASVCFKEYLGEG